MADISTTESVSPLESCANRLAQTEELTAEQWRSILRSLCDWTKVSEGRLVEGFMSALDGNTDQPGEADGGQETNTPATELTQPKKPTSVGKPEKTATSPSKTEKTAASLNEPEETAASLNEPEKTAASLNEPEKTATPLNETATPLNETATPLNEPEKTAASLNGPEKTATSLGGTDEPPTSPSKTEKTATSLNEREKTATPLNGPEKTATPLNGPEKTATPLNGPEKTATPLNGPEKTATPLNGPEKTATPPVEPEKTATPPSGPEKTATPPVEPEKTATPLNEPEKTATPLVEPEKTATPLVEPEKTATSVGKPEKTATSPSESEVPSTSNKLSAKLSTSGTQSEELPVSDTQSQHLNTSTTVPEQPKQNTASATSTPPEKLHTSSTPLQQPKDTESEHPSPSVTQQHGTVRVAQQPPDTLATDTDDHLDVDQEKISNAPDVTQRKTCARCASYTVSTCRKVTVPFLSILVVLLALSVAIDKEKIGLRLENFFQQNPDSADQWASLNMQSVRILVTGKTGTGKSALINGLIGMNVTAEGDELDPKTSEVAQFKQMVHGISLSIFDSPGLQDGTWREEEYLRDMERKCAKVDLVLYTIKMTDQRVYAADTDAMQKITNAFGQQFWEKAIFVMTFANEVRSPEYPKDELENEKYFESRLQIWREKLPEYFEQRCGVSTNIGRHIPIVPAGYYKIRDLPGRKYWFSQFWRAALNRLMESSVEGASYMLKFSQDRFKKVENITEQDFEKPIHEQPILSPNIN